MRVTDIGLAIPGLLLAAALTSVLGSGVTSLIVALIAVFWAPLARVTYGQAVVIKERPFVEAARSIGAGRVSDPREEIMPHVLPIVLAYAALSVGWAALFESSLGFLGLGVQEPTASIGAMLGSGLAVLPAAPGSDHLSRAVPGAVRDRDDADRGGTTPTPPSPCATDDRRSAELEVSGR